MSTLPPGWQWPQKLRCAQMFLSVPLQAAGLGTNCGWWWQLPTEEHAGEPGSQAHIIQRKAWYTEGRLKASGRGHTSETDAEGGPQQHPLTAVPQIL